MPTPQAPATTHAPLPKYSLPRYADPTPSAAHRKLPREEEADLALKNTKFKPGTRQALIALFLLTIVVVPAIQLAGEFRASGSISRMPMISIFKSLPWLPHAEDLKRVERSLENESLVSQWLLPRMQYLLTVVLGAGNEQVYLGHNPWLFYRADVDHVIGPPFLDPVRLKHRVQTSRVQADPVKAIVDFRDQLAARGVALVVVPVSVKPSVEGEMLAMSKANRARAAGDLPNPSFNEFKTRLEREKVRVFDPAPLLMERGKNGLLYLDTDTHWRPETMEFVAQRLADFLQLPAAAGSTSPSIVEKEIVARGDIAAMLKLTRGEKFFPPEKVTIRQVVTGNGLWRPSKDADVLLLGDSFSNIFSFEAMGWGESAGFAEHLSVALRRPIDCILRNSDASFATREILSNELARGRDRLAGKKLVIWEFAARELSFGNWKLLDLKLGEAKASHFLSLKPGEEIEVSGTVESISPVPRPGTVPYKDHIEALHVVDIVAAGDDRGSEGEEKSSPSRGQRPRLQSETQAVVYLWSMRDNVWTPAARLRPGEQVKLQLRPWPDVSAQYEKFNRTELEDSVLQLEEPVWGEEIELLKR
jgi:alginate O-acetyltransferase complex protein AlgJ